MRTGLVAILGAALGAVALAPPAAAASRSCVRSGEQVVARGAQVVVVRRGTAGAVHACHRRSRRRTRLSDRAQSRTPGAYVELFRVAGRYVAYVRGVRAPCSTCAGSATVRLVDVRAGRRRAVGPTGCDGTTHVVPALAADRRGRLGWICFRSANADPAGELVEVRKRDRTGNAVVERSVNQERLIEFGSLRLSGGALLWRVDGAERRAELS